MSPVIVSACSGLAYSGVPTIWPNCVSNVFSTAHLSVALAMPKSITLGTGAPSCSVTSTFDGFRSRWITPFWCACWTARQTARNNASRSLVVIRLRSQYWVIGAPSMYSITKYGRPLVVAPASKIWAMFGWSIIASAWRSLLKRASTWAVSMPSFTTLRATLPANGLKLLGQVHGAHAPFA